MDTIAVNTVEHLGPGASRDAFRHEALLYAGSDGFLAGTLPFIRDAVGAREPTLVMVSAPKIRLLRDALGPQAEAVQFADMEVVGANPARIIPAWRDFVDRNAASEQPLRGIGEPIWAERSPAELVECHRHEALLNLAFAEGCAMRLLCPYDTERLDDAVVAAAHHSHPTIVEDGVERESDDYQGMDVASAPFDHPLSDSPPGAGRMAFDGHTLDALRQFVAVEARRSGLPETACSDLVLAVNEVATNCVLHGGGDGTLLVWAEGDAVLCELRDRGHFDYPLAGRERPAPDRVGGHGLWLANQLCDLVQLRSFPSGTVVRLHVRRR
jgi:anti-sigma regulatory factor (Ser/Thr protein kinase)